MDSSAAGQLGSIYQGNLSSVQGEQQAETADRRRGFGVTGGLGGKATAAARRIAMNRQAGMLKDATGQLGQNTQEQQLAGQDYQDQLGVIGKKSAYDLAQTLIADPIYGNASPSPSPISNPGAPVGASPSMVQPGAAIPALNYKQLYKSNPSKYGTIRGKF
jgi:hypothetical protein